MGGRGGSGAGKAGGRAGGNGSAVNSPSNYGSGITTLKNTKEDRAAVDNGFVSNSDISRFIVVNNVTNGVSEKQISYAQSVKNNAMESVDKTVKNLLQRGADQKRTIAFRNSLMEKINSEINAKTILDNLNYKSTQDLALYYKIKP
ncbi:MAG: hypothetical protein ABFD07_17990 [Methanobacterium sp.]